MPEVVSTKLAYQPELLLLERVINYNVRADGSSKKAEELALAKERAYIAGISDGLAAILTERRIAAFPRIWEEEDYFPVVEGWATFSFVKELRRRLMELKADDEVQAFINAELHRLVYDEDLVMIEENAHREAVLRGDAAPQAEDAEWLQKHYEEAFHEADLLREAAEAAAQKVELIRKRAETRTEEGE